MLTILCYDIKDKNFNRGSQTMSYHTTPKVKELNLFTRYLHTSNVYRCNLM